MGDERTGQTQYDMYGVDNLQWDNSLYDVFGTNNEVNDYVVLKEPIQGIGYSFQATIWNWDDGYFGISGYQIDGKLSGKRYTQRS
jgi:hypothetical protein